MNQSGGGTPTQIYPLVGDEGVRTALEAAVESTERFGLVEPDSDLEGSFDLLVVDETELANRRPELEAKREAAGFESRPTLLLVSESQSGTRNIPEPRSEPIDDVLVLPIEPNELAWRLGSLFQSAGSQDKQEHNELGRSRQYEYAVEGATDMLAAADTEGRLLFANAQYREFHGLERGAVAGTPLQSVLGESDYTELQPRFDRVLQGERVQYGMKRVRADGERRAIESSMSPMEDQKGEIVGVVSAIRDVTERQANLDEIKRLSEYRRVVSAVNHELVRAGPDEEILPEIVDVLATSDLFGCTFLALVEGNEIEFLCQEGSDIATPEIERLHSEAYIEAVFEAGTLRMDDVTQPPFQQHEPDTESHSGVAIAISHDDRRYGILTVHFPPGQPPTDREVDLLEELAGDLGLALHDQELETDLATFEEIVQRIEDPIMLQDRAGNFQVINETLTEYANMSAEALYGQDEFAFMDEQTATEIARHKAEVIHGNEPRTYEVEPSFPNRGNRTFRTTRYPHYDEDGEIDGTVAICRDVTGIRERERQLQVFDRVLRHNLHNEMNVVLGHAETIANTAEGEIAAAARRIEAAGETLVELADKERQIVELLERREPRRVTDVGQIVETVVENLRANHPTARINLDVPAQLRAVTTPCIEDAIHEVIENAIIHTTDRTPEIEVRAVRDGKRVTLRVADNGPGIPEMDRQVLEGAEITPLIHGSGLGLWLVNHVVSESQGTLNFQERAPRGSIVEITLPGAE
ncbi:PAS domain-containing protein [Halodesulfurarchaeum sp. HSR-GB]|uniref:PAS domain-containing protein n=1 Tax=Halodesulfurarchaeum sp. HSR-GB TaxID=3074077 RepID=UPI002866C56F|nr:PAS domain-containing protein [Halodesulfurarchaeum sp. HSR-GB]MDR5656044.1 PAS domain-containing protein [Halodesulfurarchaeum sp. HSR-GB]